MAKEILNDARLSWRAKGILAYLLGQKDDWVVRSEDVISKSTEGRDAVRAAFVELRDTGYARLADKRDSGGKLIGREWIVSDTSDRKTDSQALGTDGLKNRRPEKPSVGKSPPSKNVTVTKKKPVTKKVSPSALLTDDSFILELKNNPGYAGIDVDREIGKMRAWLTTPKARGRHLTRQFIVNWLNKIDVPVKLNGTHHKPTTESGRNTGTANEGRSSQYEGVGEVR